MSVNAAKSFIFTGNLIFYVAIITFLSYIYKLFSFSLVEYLFITSLYLFILLSSMLSLDKSILLSIGYYSFIGIISFMFAYYLSKWTAIVFFYVYLSFTVSFLIFGIFFAIIILVFNKTYKEDD